MLPSSLLRHLPRVQMLFVAAFSFFGTRAPAQTVLKWPGEKLATIDAEHLRAYVPFEQRDQLRRLVARADQIYGQMCRDAGFEPASKLRLLMSNWQDAHNGFSFVTPFPLVQIELAPSLPASTLFAGYADWERTLIHEFAHQISNDRNHGFRGVLESIFGRVLPIDFPGLLLWYLSTPSHQTMPRFWHEGTAVWAETEYAPADSVWRGRGRDPLTHMIWRLDAEAEAIPRVDDWRITYHEWPFGSRVYFYGTAYTRHLTRAFGNEHSVWDFIDVQARSWPFFFDRAPRRKVGDKHTTLIRSARRELQSEQERILDAIRESPVTELRRLTPVDTLLGAPAWRENGDLVVAARSAHGRARLHELRADGRYRRIGGQARALGGIRTTESGKLIRHEYNWRTISRVRIDELTVGWRMLQPDARDLRSGGVDLAAIQLRAEGGQELVVHRVERGKLGPARVLSTQGMPSSPVWRRGAARGDELLWVEVSPAGSRLVLASASAPEVRRVLAEVAGRIMHPVFTADGEHVYFCSDHTGVANAYRLSVPDSADAEPEVLTVTNTIGGIVACVPSPDGKTLAIVDHDRRGPFLAKLSGDPDAWVPRAVQIDLEWPAPARGTESEERAADVLPTTPAEGGLEREPERDPVRQFRIPSFDESRVDQLDVSAYNGFRETRPLFWAPTTFAVPEGGYGVIGLASDPIFSHIVDVGLGVGLVESEFVGTLGYTYLGAPIELGLRAGRKELNFDDVVRDALLRDYDYSETVTGGEVRFGRGLFALERTFLLHASLGIEAHDDVSDSTRFFAGQGLVSAPIFEGTERYAEVTVGYDDSTFFPTSYGPEDGVRVSGVFRHSGFGGDLDRNTALGQVGYVLSVAPEAGHQVILRSIAGWSDGDRTLQGNFGIGGGLGRGFPRGYISETAATGRHLIGGGLGYRFPVWRPFAAPSTMPFRSRQVALEVFSETAKVSDNHMGGDGDWFTSAGLEVLLNVEIFDNIVSPGIGVAYQFDGDRDVEAYFTLGVSF